MVVVEGERGEGDVKFCFERLQEGKLPKSNKCEQGGRGVQILVILKLNIEYIHEN